MLRICDRFPAVHPDEVPEMDASVLGILNDEQMLKAAANA